MEILSLALLSSALTSLLSLSILAIIFAVCFFYWGGRGGVERESDRTAAEIGAWEHEFPSSFSVLVFFGGGVHENVEFRHLEVEVFLKMLSLAISKYFLINHGD